MPDPQTKLVNELRRLQRLARKLSQRKRFTPSDQRALADLVLETARLRSTLF